MAQNRWTGSDDEKATTRLVKSSRTDKDKFEHVSTGPSGDTHHGKWVKRGGRVTRSKVAKHRPGKYARKP